MIKYGFIAKILERLFYWVGCGTSGWIIGVRIHTTEEHDVMKRARRVDALITSCFLTGFALVLALPVLPRFPWIIRALIVFLVIWRLVDIIQCHTNMLIFDHLRKQTGLRTASVTRNLVNSFIGYIEILFIFAVLYGLNLSNLIGAVSAYDGIYFSVISQLTIGYGDIHPTQMVKGLAMAQGVIGFFYGLMILGKIVSLMPVMYGRTESSKGQTPNKHHAHG